MAKITIGFITNSRLPNIEDNKFKRIAKKLDVNFIVFNAAEKIELDDLKKKAKQCDIILNDEADFIGLELAKTLELLGDKVVEYSKSYYYTEDKWLQYMQFVKHKIPTPKTMLLSTDLVSIAQELKDFNQFPVVLKRISGFHGDFVDKADNIDEAVKVIKGFWKKGENRFPIIAQEFIDSYSYRVMTIGGEVVQTAIKKNDGWKATGTSAHRFCHFKINAELKRILAKIKKISDIAICGIDLAKNKGHWLVIEINGQPSYNFFDCDVNNVIEKTLRHLIKLAKKIKRK